MAVFSVSIRELRPKLPEVVSDVSDNMNRYVITKRGKPVCVILSTHDYDSLIESLGLQSDEALMKEIQASENAFKKTRGKKLEDIKKGL